MNQINIKNKMIYWLIAALASMQILSACSSDEVEAVINDETVKVSGIIRGESDAPLGGVTVKAIYSDNDPLNPSTTTAPDGTFSLTVLKNIAFSLQASANNYITLNSEKAASDTDITDVDFGLPTTAQAQQVIDDALGVNTTPLGNVAWLVVDVFDANGNEVGGVTISTNADAEVYTACDGTDSTGTMTVAPCVEDRAVMYIAYFTSAGDISVTVAGDTKTAPVRLGEITLVEFEQ